MTTIATTPVPPPRFGFNVLQLIKTGQAQHGLRHGDYKRYRRYCTARLLRLYKCLNFKHGRGKYIKKPISEATVTDVRFLHIVLYSAERAWSYAMDIKQIPGGPNRSQQAHLICRLAKAAKWGDKLNQLCSHKADSRTALEALAYAQYMRGNLLLEREDDWESAVKNFKSARQVYDELGKFGDVENHVICRQRVEELDTIIRYCMYKMNRSEIRSSDILELTQEGLAFDLLQSKLEAVMAESRQEQAVSMTELEWLGRKLPIKNEKIRVCILKGQVLEKDLSGNLIAPILDDKKLGIYDKLFLAYHDAKRHIREDLVLAGSTEDVREELNGLDRAVSSILLQRTVERNQVLVNLAKNRLSRQQKGLREEKGEKPAKPEDLVRLYETLIQNVTDLTDIVTSGREKTGNEISFAKILAAQRQTFQAERSFYLAQSYNVAAKYAEAYVLFNRTKEHALSALESQKKLEILDEGTIGELNHLVENSTAQKCLVHARGVSEDSKEKEIIHKGIASLALTKESSHKAEASYLLDKLDKYESCVGSAESKEHPRIAQIPPPFEAVPCRPIVLDTALNWIEFPSLEGRLHKEDKKRTFLSKWWGR